MKKMQPNIQIPVDLTNPGQFFACCGLLELADRLWPGAEGWFEASGTFCIASSGSFTLLVEAFKDAELRSSLTANELKRLGTLMSVSKAGLSVETLVEKARLQRMWKVEVVHVGSPFNFQVDWWHDERGDRLDPKTWAAKQLVMEIIGDLHSAIQHMPSSDYNDVWPYMRSVGRRFNFDSNLGAMGSAIDVGFSFDALEGSKRNRVDVACRPFVELLAFIGLQRCRPVKMKSKSLFTYNCWHVPLEVSVISAATSQNPFVPSSTFQFELFDRTDYFKSFLPAIPFQGDHDE